MKSWTSESVKGGFFEHLFPIVSATLILVCGVLLYFNMTAGAGAGSGKVIGKIIFKNRVAQRKYSNQVVWGKLTQAAPVYNRDTLRTEDLAEAVVLLDDGTRIEMDQNSMIVLNITAKTAEIRFARGSINTKRSDTSSDKSLQIKAGDTVIDSSKGDVRLAAAGPKKQVTVTLKKGQANVERAGKKQLIKENQQALLSSKKIVVRKVNLKLNSPPDNGRFFGAGRVAVAFSWKKAADAKKPVFQVAADRSFRSPVLTRAAGGTGTRASLPAGVYYWRLSSDGGKFASDARRINVVRRAPVKLFTPLKGRKYEYSSKPPLISFSWGKNEYASSYVLEVSKSRTFSGAVKKELFNRFTGLNLEAGTWYWRVASRSSTAGAGAQSPVQSFLITKKAKRSAPRPLSPGRGASVNSFVFTKRGVMFNWVPDSEIKNYTLSIARDAGFKQTLVNRASGANFTRVRKDLKPGRYFWRVRGRDQGGIQTDFSTVFSFRVIKVVGLKLSGPAPSVQMEMPKNAKITFRWKKAGAGLRYRLIASSTPDFKKKIINKTTSSSSLSGGPFPPGKVYWKVALLDEKGAVISESKSRSLVVKAIAPLKAPGLLGPRPGTSVNMTRRDTIDFRWRKTRGADSYIFSLYRLSGGRKKVHSSRVVGLFFRFREVDKLNTGKYLWTLTARRTAGGRIYNSPLSRGNFTISLDRLNKPRVTSPELFWKE